MTVTKVIMKELYMKVSKHNGYDDCYLKLDPNDGSWKGILSNIEAILDDKYIHNDDEVLGIKFSMEIVDKVPRDVEFDEF